MLLQRPDERQSPEMLARGLWRFNALLEKIRAADTVLHLNFSLSAFLCPATRIHTNVGRANSSRCMPEVRHLEDRAWQQERILAPLI